MAQPTHEALPTIAVLGIGVAGVLTILVMPGLVGGLIDSGGFTAGQAGRIAALDTLGLVLGAVLVLAFGRARSPSRSAAAGLCLLVAANLLSMVIHEYSLLWPIRLIAGIGGGVAYATANGVIAGMHNPDRLFGWLTAALLGVSTLVFFTLPALQRQFGVAGLFCLFAGGGGLMLACTRFMPNGSVRPARAGEGSARLSRQVAYAVAAMLIYSGGVGASWAYVERMGAAASLGRDQVGTALALAAVLGVAGALVASWLDRRVGRTAPLAVGNLLLAGATIGIQCSADVLSYGVALLVFQFAWSMTIPYYFGVLAEIDPSGRMVILSIVMQTAGMSLGPAIAAAALDRGASYGDIVWLTCIALSLSLALIISVVRPLDRPAAFVHKSQSRGNP